MCRRGFAVRDIFNGSGIGVFPEWTDLDPNFLPKDRIPLFPRDESGSDFYPKGLDMDPPFSQGTDPNLQHCLWFMYKFLLAAVLSLIKGMKIPAPGVVKLNSMIVGFIPCGFNTMGSI